MANNYILALQHDVKNLLNQNKIYLTAEEKIISELIYSACMYIIKLSHKYKWFKENFRFEFKYIPDEDLYTVQLSMAMGRNDNPGSDYGGCTIYINKTRGKQEIIKSIYEVACMGPYMDEE